jgi:hypothetical protein
MRGRTRQKQPVTIVEIANALDVRRHDPMEQQSKFIRGDAELRKRVIVSRSTVRRPREDELQDLLVETVHRGHSLVSDTGVTFAMCLSNRHSAASSSCRKFGGLSARCDARRLCVDLRCSLSCRQLLGTAGSLRPVLICVSSGAASSSRSAYWSARCCLSEGNVGVGSRQTKA